MRERTKSGGHVVDLLFTLALFCVFVVSSMLVIVIGADAYTSSLDRMDASFDSRTALSYIANKVHQNDEAGAVYIGSFDGIPALVMEIDLGDERVFKTYVYHYGGYLREVLAGPDSEVTPEGGQALIALTALQMEEAGDGLLRFTCTDSAGGETELLLAPRSEVPHA